MNFKRSLKFARGLKVSKSRKQFMVSLILQKNRKKLTILSIFFNQDSDFRLFLRIQKTINYFPYLLTFKKSS